MEGVDWLLHRAIFHIKHRLTVRVQFNDRGAGSFGVSEQSLDQLIGRCVGESIAPWDVLLSSSKLREHWAVESLDDTAPPYEAQSRLTI